MSYQLVHKSDIYDGYPTFHEARADALQLVEEKGGDAQVYGLTVWGTRAGIVLTVRPGTCGPIEARTSSTPWWEKRDHKRSG